MGMGFIVTCICTYILFITLGDVVEHQRKSMILSTYIRAIDEVYDRVKNLHYNTENEIKIQSLVNLAQRMGIVLGDDDFGVIHATVQRIWLELGDKRPLRLTRDSISVATKTP